MTRRGAGTLRQRRPGVWEIRVCVGTDPVSGVPRQRSVTVHGDVHEAEQRRSLLAAQAAQAEQLRQRRQVPAATVADLLQVWLAAEHDWKPATWQGYRQAARRLSADPIARRPPEQVSPPVLRAAMRSWQEQGRPTSTICLHVRVLKAAFGWAFDERLIACQPLQGMRGPGSPEPRRDVPLEMVRELLRAAQHDVAAAPHVSRSTERLRRVHTAEQVALLLRLAADTGARRGELGALRLDDLHGRRLHIDRGISAEIVTTTKTGRSRRVTVGATTAALWQQTLTTWQARLPAGQTLGPWLFSAHPDHSERAPCGTLGHWFAAFARRHGHPDVCLHRLRHTVATILADGKLLQAQQRLGHREASTTLRQYCHALPLHDTEVADSLDALLNLPAQHEGHPTED